MMEEEGSVTKIAIGHVDNEADMLRKELYKIGKYSVELYKMLGELPDGDFPHWWQGKVIKAGEYIGSAKHYLEGELFASEEELQFVMTKTIQISRVQSNPNKYCYNYITGTHL